MVDYNQIKDFCKEQNRISEEVLDEFLIYYAVDKDNLEPIMNRRFKRYKHIFRKFPQGSEASLKAQYIAHRIFRKDGLIRKYLKHSRIKNLLQKEYQYLELLSRTPWKFSFSIIIDNPAEDFFEMKDVFTGDEFLLHSPGITRIKKESEPQLWFNLLGYNGKCWQSYGPIAFYKSFTPDDIFFFATELNANISSDDGLMKDVWRNPVPYMTLLSGAELPPVVHGNQQIFYIRSWVEISDIDVHKMKEDFMISENESIVKLDLKGWQEFPHFAMIYFDPFLKELLISSMTELGYAKLQETLNKYDVAAPDFADIRLTVSMLSVMNDILKREIQIDDYVSLFKEDPEEKDEEEIKSINQMMGEMIPDINKGQTPDYDELSQKYDIAKETIEELANNLIKKLGR